MIKKEYIHSYTASSNHQELWVYRIEENHIDSGTIVKLYLSVIEEIKYGTD